MEKVFQIIWNFLKSIPEDILHYPELFQGTTRDKVMGWGTIIMIGICILIIIKIQYFPELSIVLPQRKLKKQFFYINFIIIITRRLCRLFVSRIFIAHKIKKCYNFYEIARVVQGQNASFPRKRSGVQIPSLAP